MCLSCLAFCYPCCCCCCDDEKEPETKKVDITTHKHYFSFFSSKDPSSRPLPPSTEAVTGNSTPSTSPTQPSQNHPQLLQLPLKDQPKSSSTKPESANSHSQTPVLPLNTSGQISNLLDSHTTEKLTESHFSTTTTPSSRSPCLCEHSGHTQANSPNFSSSSVPHLWEVNSRRRKLVRSMIIEGWTAYARHSWGAWELDLGPKKEKPGSLNFNSKTGYTIITSMSTLWIAGLTKEFTLGRKWIVEKFHFASITDYVEVSKVVGGYIGGLLSCYALTKEVVFLEKALEVSRRLESAYAGDGGLPYKYFRPSDRAVSGPNVSTSTLASGLLEYGYLAEVVSNEADHVLFSDRLRNIKGRLLRLARSTTSGLYHDAVDIKMGDWILSKAGNSTCSFFESCRGAYQGFLALSIASRKGDSDVRNSNNQDEDPFEEYLRAIEAAHKAKLLASSTSGYTYTREYHPLSGAWGDYMDCSGHYLGGTLALGARAGERRRMRKMSKRYVNTSERERIATHWRWAKELAETGRWVAVATATGLPPKESYFTVQPETGSTPEGPKDTSHEKSTSYSTTSTSKKRTSNREYLLSGELAETYFTLYRLTGEAKYREWAWQLVEAIRKYCRGKHRYLVDDPNDKSAKSKLVGSTTFYGTIKDVNWLPVQRTPHQPAEFLATTLKYLFLIFTDDGKKVEDEFMSLERWVFSPIYGQPLPVYGGTREKEKEKQLGV